MKAKEYLLQIETLQTKIEQKRQRAKEYRELALTSGGFDYSKERVQTSNHGGQIENPVIRYISLEQEISEDVLNLQQIKDKITREIHNINNADFIKMLYKRYVECESLWSIAKDMGYSYDRIRHIHGEALKEFEKINLSTQ
nr:MAG TPA: Protein of unknown function (DUF1492) [Caudoviricetes sp.]